MPGPRNRTGTDPSLNHPLTMSYMGAGSGWEKGWGAGIFTLPCERDGRGPKGRGGGVYGVYVVTKPAGHHRLPYEGRSSDGSIA
jgi:hypothetical protein